MTNFAMMGWAVVSVTFLLTGSLHAQPPERPVLAKQLVPARASGVNLRVSSGAFGSGSSLDDRYTQNGQNSSPPISWTKGPAGTISYAIIMEDAGANGSEPVTHWIVYDLASTATQIPGNQPAQAQLSFGALQGLNVRNAVGFIGPKPPVGETHPYHFQVFALNTRLKLDPTQADRDDVLNAMKGHVLASGDLVATYTGK